MKLNESDIACLEHLLNFRYGNYVQLKYVKDHKVWKHVTPDCQQVNIPAESDLLEQLDSLIEGSYKKYLDALQFIEKLECDSFVDEESSKFSDSGRVHKVIQRSAVKYLTV